MGKLLIVGDVHGCADELKELVEKAEIGKDDTVILTGDVWDRGPKPAELLDYLKANPNIHTILGNHDAMHLEAGEEGKMPTMSAAAQIGYLQAGPEKHRELVEYLKEQPLAIRTPYCIVVHGAMEPGKPLEEQDPNLLAGDRNAQKELEDRLGSRWEDAYDGKLPVIVGHRNYHWEYKNKEKEFEPFIHKNEKGGLVIGLDTTPDMGHNLSGIVFPEGKILSVPAKADYWKQVKQEYGFDKMAVKQQAEQAMQKDKKPKREPFPRLSPSLTKVKTFDAQGQEVR